MGEYAEINLNNYTEEVFEYNLSLINDYAAGFCKSLSLNFDEMRTVNLNCFKGVFKKFSGIECLNYDYTNELKQEIDLSEIELPNIKQISLDEIDILDKIKYSEQVYTNVEIIILDLSVKSYPNIPNMASFSEFKQLMEIRVFTNQCSDEFITESIVEDFNYCVRKGIIPKTTKLQIKMF